MFVWVAESHRECVFVGVPTTHVHPLAAFKHTKKSGRLGCARTHRRAAPLETWRPLKEKRERGAG